MTAINCCICADEIQADPSGWKEGHNAEPVVNGGRCCEDCNTTIIIPSRLMGAPDFLGILKKERLDPDFADRFIWMFKDRKVNMKKKEEPTVYEMRKLEARKEFEKVKEKVAAYL